MRESEEVVRNAERQPLVTTFNRFFITGMLLDAANAKAKRLTHSDHYYIRERLIEQIVTQRSQLKEGCEYGTTIYSSIPDSESEAARYELADDKHTATNHITVHGEFSTDSHARLNSCTGGSRVSDCHQ